MAGQDTVWQTLLEKESENDRQDNDATVSIDVLTQGERQLALMEIAAAQAGLEKAALFLSPNPSLAYFDIIGVFQAGSARTEPKGPILSEQHTGPG